MLCAEVSQDTAMIVDIIQFLAAVGGEDFVFPLAVIVSFSSKDLYNAFL